MQKRDILEVNKLVPRMLTFLFLLPFAPPSYHFIKVMKLKIEKNLKRKENLKHII
jgi:hypothetical protein